MKQQVKNWFLPQGRRIHHLRRGLAGGVLMELDLAHQSQQYLGLYERELLQVLRRLIPFCKSLVDVGANDGYYTMVFLKSAAQRVVACEPGPVLRQLLVNAEANGHRPNERFSVEQRLVGNQEGMVTIAELVENLPQPILLKVDIDGGEADLLASAEKCGFLPELWWIIETHSKELEAQCIQWLQAHYYRTRVIRNAWWRCVIPEQRPLEHNRWLLAEPAVKLN